MRRLKRRIAGMMVGILCAMNVLQPLCTYADELPQTPETVMETVAETEAVQAPALEAAPESESLAETERGTVAAIETVEETEPTSTSEAETETESVPESQMESESESENEIEPVRYTVSGTYSGQGHMTITDNLGNVYELPGPEGEKKFECADQSQVTLKISPDEGYEIDAVEIDQQGNIENIVDAEILNATEIYEKIVTVTADTNIRVAFAELPQAPETETEMETVSESQMETESGSETESIVESDLKEIIETEPEPQEETKEKGKYEGIAKDGDKTEVAEGYIAENEEEMDSILHPEISLFSYDGQTLYVSAGSYTAVYDNGFTNRYNVVGDGDTMHYAYCLQPDAPDPSGSATVYEVDNFNIKLVLCLAMYGPAQQYGFDAGIWPGADEYNNGAKLPAAFGYVHATLGYLYGAGPGIGLSSANAAQLDSWVQACIDVYNNNPEVKKIVDNAQLFYMYGGTQQDVAWVEYTPPKNGWVELQKSSANPEISDNSSCYSLAGAVYGVYDASGAEVAQMVTDDTGYAKSGELPEGNYTVKEITAPRGFALDQSAHGVTIEPDQTAHIDVVDYPQSDPVSVILNKINPDGSVSAGLANAEFTVKYYSNYDASGAPERTWILKTDKNGRTYFVDDLKISGDDFFRNSNGYASLPLGSITIQETKAPEGYLINEEIFVRQITASGAIEQVKTYNAPTIPETPQVIQIELSKVDSETNKAEAQGTGSLKGAEYNVINADNKVVDTLVTDEKGYAISKELPLGVYTVKETASSNGYLVDVAAHIVDASKPQDDTSRVFKYKVTSGEDVIRGDVEIIKFYENIDEDNDTLHGIEGVEFTFTSKTTGKVVKKIVTDKTGFATTASADQPRGSLVFDTYIVTETKWPAGVKPIEPFEVTISQEGVVHKGIYKEDKLIVSPVTVVKKDRSTGKIIPAANTEFRLLDADKNPVTMTSHYPATIVYETFKTDDKGQFTFPDKLKYGTYYLEEVNAPDGYLKGELLEFKVTEGASWENPLVIEFFDDVAMGKIRVEKKDAESGKPLDGAEFDLIAAEDIMTPDGTLQLKKGDIADHLVTKDGAAESKELYLGNYELRETKQPQGFILSDEVYPVTLEYKDQVTPVVLENVEVKNTPVKVRIIKIDSESGKALPGVEFKIWNKAMAEGDIDADMAVNEPYITDENGVIELGYLAPGTYCVQETKSIFGYALDDTIHEFVVSEDGRIDGKEIGEIIIKNTPVEIGTKATDKVDGDQLITNTGKETIVDTVAYKGLIPGKEYTVSGILMVKSTGKPLLDNGKEVTAELTFVPEAADGEVKLEFTFNAMALAGEKLVAFESVKYEKLEIASHTDIEDEDQTIEVVPVKIGTKAADQVDGDQVIPADEDMTIIDTVTYSHLHAGWTYILKGVLMDKSTGKPLLTDGKEVTSEVTFIPEAEDGEVTVEFTFDATGLKDVDLVVFEELYHESEMIAEHKDIEDKGQTIDIVQPEIKTTAVNKAGGSKEITAKGTVTILDTVSYTDLIPGRKYTVSGILMDKATGKAFMVNGKEITAQTEFIPDKASGTVDVEFTFDATGLKDMDLVVFEKLLNTNGKVIAVHEDINDEGQTVHLKKEVVPDTPKTGDESMPHSAGLLCLMSLSVMCLALSFKRRKDEI